MRREKACGVNGLAAATSCVGYTRRYSRDPRRSQAESDLFHVRIWQQRQRTDALLLNSGQRHHPLPLRPTYLTLRPKQRSGKSISGDVAAATLRTRSEIGIGLAVATLKLPDARPCSTFRSNRLTQPFGARPLRWIREYSRKRCKSLTGWQRLATARRLLIAALQRDGLSRLSARPARSSIARLWLGHDPEADRHTVRSTHHSGSRNHLERLCLARPLGAAPRHRSGWRPRHQDLVS